jgi:hypothetical protein
MVGRPGISPPLSKKADGRRMIDLFGVQTFDEAQFIGYLSRIGH